MSASRLRLTVGAGDDRPQGRALEVPVTDSRVRALVDALNALPGGQAQGWWSAACFEDGYRDKAHWLSSEAVGVDLDWYGEPVLDDKTAKWRSARASVPAQVLEDYRRAVEGGSLAGSAAHETPGGFRVVFLLDSAVTDPEALLEAAKGAVALLGRWVADRGLTPRQTHGVPAHGLKVDVPASTDRVRFWYAPRAQAKGVRRNATVVLLRDRTYSATELASFRETAASPATRAPVPATAAGADFAGAAAAFNAAHPGGWPASHGSCPACGHHGCFGASAGDPDRWACWSSNHGQDSGGCGLRGERCWHGDALDLAAHAARLSRADLLRREGLLPHVRELDGSGSVGSVGSVGRDPDGWGPLLRLGLEQPPPPFPVEALPVAIGRWAEGTAVMLQCPIDLPAVLGLGVGALSVAKKRVVEVHERWREPLNQYRAAGLPSGESKSPAFDGATLPVRTWEAAMLKRLRPAHDRAERERRGKQDRIQHLQRKAARLPGGEERDTLTTEIAALAAELAEAPRIILPKLFCEDVTPEKLAEELGAHHGLMALLSDEAGPFEMMLGRYSDSPRLEVYLKSYSGTLLLVDRKGLPGAPVPPLRVERPTLTIVLTVQPEVVAGLAAKREMRSRGLLARFAFCMPASRVGSRLPDAPPIATAVVEEYAGLVWRLLDLQAPQSAEGEYAPLPIRLSREAHGLLRELRAELEPRLAPGCDLAPMQDWVNKHPGRVLRVAGLLHLADLPREHGQAESTISGEEMERAIQVGAYDLAHSRLAFASMAEPEEVASARHVVEWLVRKGVSTFKERDAHRALEHRFERAEELRQALDVLEERGHIRRQAVEARPGNRGGRPPSPVFEVHPEVHALGARRHKPTEPTEPAAEGGGQ